MAPALRTVRGGAKAGVRLLGLAPTITVALFLAPVGAGLAATLLPALGVHPAIDGSALPASPFAVFFSLPGVGTALRFTLFTGLAATLASFAITILLCAALSHTRAFARLVNLLSPLLATPHAAAAIGLAFVLAPSGWMMRLASGPLGIERPPDVLLIGDPWGVSFILALVCKEVPYLLLMLLAALSQVRPSRELAVARTMGYGPVAAWLRTVLPRVYPQLRLPIFAVLAFSLSVVDVAMIIGPTTPPPLSVLVLQLFNHRELAMQLPGAAGALTLFVLVLGCIGAWLVVERLVARLARPYLSNGRRGGSGRATAGSIGLMAWGLGTCAALSLAVLALWSVARVWRFPSPLPQSFTLGTWERAWPALGDPLWVTLIAGVGAVVVACTLVLACLQNEDVQPPNATTDSAARRRALWLLYTPLLVPQISFLFGTQVIFIHLGIDGTWLALIWSHLLFVLPYMFLSLADAWRSADPRYARTAACLGAGPVRVFFRVKLPMLAAPLAIACAIGMAVSVGQYLPTLFAGAGRFATLTTEAVTLATGADRRVTAVYAFLQAMVPLAVYLAAIWLPRLAFRHRTGMRGTP